MFEIQFRSCLLRDVPYIQRLVDDLFKSYPAEDGLRPNISRTYSEFMRFP